MDSAMLLLLFDRSIQCCCSGVSINATVVSVQLKASGVNYLRRNHYAAIQKMVFLLVVVGYFFPCYLSFLCIFFLCIFRVGFDWQMIVPIVMCQPSWDEAGCDAV